MKKFTLLLLATLSITTVWATEFTVGKIKYNITDDTNLTVEVINNGSYYTGDIDIPESVTYNENTYTVTAIGADAFKSRGVTSVTIPESVTSIGSNAFLQCNKLTSITIPANTTTIGEYAFAACTGLTEITIPEKVASIGNCAFENCTGLTAVNYNAATMSSTISSNNPPFKGCSNVTTLTIGESVESMPSLLFSGIKATTLYYNATNCSFPSNGQVTNNTALTSATIGSNVESIDGYLFRSSTNLAKVTSLATTPPTINSKTFYETTTSNIALIVPATSVEAYQSADCWKEFAIYEMVEVGEKFKVDNIHYLVTADGKVAVTYEGDNSSDAEEYTGEVIIPESVTYKGVTYSVTSIGDDAFYFGWNLTAVTIPSSVTEIGENAFYFCKLLTSVNIPGSVTSIGSQAFRLCSDMTSVTIGNGVAEIGYYAFAECSVLASVTIPNSVTEIGEGAFNICYGLTSASIGDSVITIGNSAFSYCSALTAVTIGNSVAEIGDKAFSHCTALTSVTIPNSVTSIGSQAFHLCSSMTSATIGNGVTEIGDQAFHSCSALTEMTCLAANTPAIGGENTFYNITSTIPVYVPAGSLEAYQNAEYWSYFTNFQPIAANATTDKMYYLDYSNNWTVEEGSKVEAVFTNIITGYKATVAGTIAEESSAFFYLAEGNSFTATGVENALYTHIEFRLVDDETVTATTGALYYADANKPVYNLANGEWIEKNQATGIEEAVAEETIVVRGNVVTAEGDIYVYNMSGVMVAHGNNEIDLNNLQRGIYLIQAGDTVKKVVR